MHGAEKAEVIGVHQDGLVHVSQLSDRFIKDPAEVLKVQQKVMVIPVVMVNESGASIYSASEVAREEFPNHDLTVRGAV